MSANWMENSYKYRQIKCASSDITWKIILKQDVGNNISHRIFLYFPYSIK